MKKILINSLMIMFLGIIFYSCSEDPVKPPVNNDPSNKYFPLKVGSWWTYTNYTLDRDGNKIDTTEFNSKYIIGDTVTQEGKLAYIFNIQDLLGNKIEDNKFYYTTKTQVFEYFKLLPPLNFSFPIDIPLTWYKLSDESGTEWTLFKQDIDSVELQVSGFTVILNDEFEIKAENEGIEDVTYGTNMDKTVSAKKFKVSYIYGGNSLYLGITIQIPFTVESIYYFAENIGLVKQVMNPMVIELMGSEFFRMPGTEQILLDYYIAE
ncbi:MAG: hypothetical protein V1779_05230 [bacterium]